MAEPKGDDDRIIVTGGQFKAKWRGWEGNGATREAALADLFSQFKVAIKRQIEES